MMTEQLKLVANELRTVRPSADDQRRNPDLDVQAIWRDDVEHTIKCKGLDDTTAAQFRAACGL